METSTSASTLEQSSPSSSCEESEESSPENDEEFWKKQSPQEKAAEDVTKIREETATAPARHDELRKEIDRQKLQNIQDINKKTADELRRIDGNTIQAIDKLRNRNHQGTPLAPISVQTPLSFASFPKFPQSPISPLPEPASPWTIVSSEGLPKTSEGHEPNSPRTSEGHEPNSPRTSEGHDPTSPRTSEGHEANSPRTPNSNLPPTVLGSRPSSSQSGTKKKSQLGVGPWAKTRQPRHSSGFSDNTIPSYQSDDNSTTPLNPREVENECCCSCCSVFC